LKGSLVLDPGTIRRARSRFLDQGEVPRGVLTPVIERSWTRCASIGVPIDRIRDIARLSEPDIRSANDRYHGLIEQAVPVMENLYQQIANTRSMVILSDSNGLILRSIGDPDFVSRAEQVALRPGVSWAEDLIGTNAVGTAIIERAPTIIYAAEHYVERNNFLTCSAVPIFDPCGKLAGVLDISGDYRAHQDHTIALVRFAAQIIEAQLFSKGFPGEIIVHFHRSAEYLDSLMEAKAVFDHQGRLLGANQFARQLLCVETGDMGGTFTDYFDVPFGLAIGQARPGVRVNIVMRLNDGTAVCARIEDPGRHPPIALPQATQQAEPPARRKPAALRLEDLSLGDARMDAAISRAKRVLGKDIPILVEGESGTGKELLAKAIHESGPRASQAFVAVNCAAIPEGLIESELFGYAEGAFTSAKRKGHTGKIQMADRGTLFLDEIGDMPLALQASLLRVLQERLVTPLGSSKACPVDIAVICATHRRLREMVASGRFREDLYYRLNGLALTLPPLRERTDLRALVEKLVAQENRTGVPIRIDDELMEMFVHHPWPGNIRELYNVVRTAIALTGEDGRVTADCLPEDFLEEYREAAPADVPSVSPAMVVMGEVRLEHIELQAIASALEAHGGNVSAAARQLGVSRNTIYRKLKGS
jgi:transcriptional regulator of acetoin/glycerol metabolism